MGGELVIFPAALLDPSKKDEVLIFLRELPAPPRRKKQALVAWCRAVGAALTRDMVEAVLGPTEKYVEAWRE